ncbi:protein-S-isoprenylcysteine O-methyltransferase Ste14 [Methanolinea mesophila]|uniref:methyltransferase family protein n=1 Tax=Methanolinea mesophila TaxID=547055 RepID=UPI001AEA6168|nr:methyltransferase [Methanolinea mesophila]MBP1929782.1 protein-S-isoprenylcysteine O-methyltransferase Ste14 [Methanolinea mesophila]
MIEAVLVTILPVGFLIILFGGGAAFLRKNIEQDGETPIDRTLFYTSKYSVIILWGAMVLQSWGIGLSFFEVPLFLRVTGLIAWFFGFTFLYVGRFEMGSSFRLGTPKERTLLRVDGLFGLSRNPMYVGMYATICASALYTLNPAVIILGSFVIAVHHSIVRAEEHYMQKAYGQEYTDYRNRVGRYI